MGLFDVHAHLTDPRLAAVEDAVLARARAAGVSTIISNGLNPLDNEAVRALSTRHEEVRPAFGFYPVDTVLWEMAELGSDYPRDSPPTRGEDGVAWLRENVEGCFAVGEIGLDRHWVPRELWPRQEEIFAELVRVAMAADRAIIIHSRKAEVRAFEILQALGATRVNWHCFSSRVKLARRIAAAGHYLSIPGNARKSSGFTRLLEVLPRERILLETDCPYLSPVPGEPSEPAHVAGTAAYAAELWGCEVEAVQARIEQNFTELFGSAP